MRRRRRRNGRSAAYAAGALGAVAGAGLAFFGAVMLAWKLKSAGSSTLVVDEVFPVAAVAGAAAGGAAGYLLAR